jgi:3-oxoacyl-[acyl-carrier-protein] synthase II
MPNNHASKRVVVTGLGVVSSIGTGLGEFWSSLLEGKSGISQVELFDTSGFSTSVGGEVKDFEPSLFIQEENIPKYGRTSHLAIASARLALADAGLTAEDLAQGDVGIYLGTTMGECQVREAMGAFWMDKGMVLRGDVERLPDSVVPANIACEMNIHAHCLMIPTACAAGNYAISYGFDQLKSDKVSIVLAGGADSFSHESYVGFDRMMSLAHDKCRPFDKNRKGIVIGEGAGMLVLETLEHALMRGSRIYAELLGYGLSCDAHHMTIPHVDGIELVMARALEAAPIAPADVDLVCAHGTGTRMNDRTEYQALKRVLGSFEERVPVVSIKSMVGHTMGAASAMEATASVMCIHDSKIPPTINFETPDQECPVDCVPNVMREANVDVVLNNSFAFGGNNCTTVFAGLQ